MIRRIIKRIEKHGFIGFCKVIPLHIYREYIAQEKRIIYRENRQFDKYYGTDTSQSKHATKFNTESTNKIHGYNYETYIEEEEFSSILSSLDIDFNSFTFIDFGSGKGKMLLFASNFSFKSVIGVEFDQELNTIAEVNIIKYSKRYMEQKCKNIKSVCCDATALKIPTDSLVCLFSNPFDEVIVQQVLQNIEHSFHQKKREVYVIYHNPKHEYIFEKTSFWKKIMNVKHGIYECALYTNSNL